MMDWDYFVNQYSSSRSMVSQSTLYEIKKRFGMKPVKMYEIKRHIVIRTILKSIHSLNLEALILIVFDNKVEQKWHDIKLNLIDLFIMCTARQHLCVLVKDKLVFILAHDEVIIKLQQKHWGNHHHNFFISICGYNPDHD